SSSGRTGPPGSGRPPAPVPTPATTTSTSPRSWPPSSESTRAHERHLASIGPTDRPAGACAEARPASGPTRRTTSMSRLASHLGSWPLGRARHGQLTNRLLEPRPGAAGIEHAKLARRRGKPRWRANTGRRTRSGTPPRPRLTDRAGPPSERNRRRASPSPAGEPSWLVATWPRTPRSIDRSGHWPGRAIAGSGGPPPRRRACSARSG
ncbi:MAG: hypothetical protein QOK40_336, partial [Miltoncostaeaceae bacterium]|nr:hypothetical protein [Miltoncostaeaceae bacterium]